MSRVKGSHIFKVGDLVMPHPLIYRIYKDTDETDLGIVLQRIPPKHPITDYRKVRIFWQHAMRENIYFAHLVYHLHNEETLKNEKNFWNDVLDHMMYEYMLENTFSKYGIEKGKYPVRNPCKIG